MRQTTDGSAASYRPSPTAALARAGLALFLFVVLAASLPLLGAWWRGTPIAPLLAFPPTTEASVAPGFSGLVFGVLTLLIAATLAPFGWRWWRANRTRTAPARAFPWWGWAGILVLAIAWAVAWTRLPALAEVQRYSFTPLWIGYILVVNALSYRRSGHCLVRDRPLYLAALFPLSAVFWWYFEYLNRFVQNWYYEGVDALTPGAYVLEASLPFATVLPAVLSTAECLATFRRGNNAFARWRALPWAHHRAVTWIALALGCAGLIAIGRWPYYSYPLVWVAPFGLLCALQALPGHRPLCDALARGDWRPVVFPALAALICGFFWELWNYGSLARWVYVIPYVGALRLFEMPLLGYAGYLPFGLTCAAIVDLFPLPKSGCDPEENGVRLPATASS